MSATGEHIDYKELYEQQLQFNQQLLQSNQQLQASNEALQSQLLTVQYQLQQVTKLLQGFKSERFVPSLATEPQKELGLIFEEAAASTKLADVQKISITKVKKQPAERPPVKELPAGLKRIITVIEPDEDISHCEKVGEEVIETLDYKPGELIVNRTVIVQYRCAAEGKAGTGRLVQGSRPARAIERSIADPGLLAHITIAKFVDAQPLNRQWEQFKRHGVQLPYSTIADWIKLVAQATGPLADALLRDMLRYGYWHADETGIAVLDNTKKKETHQGYFWVFKAGNAPLIYYDYQPGRDSHRPQEILNQFTGHLQTDGYTVYSKLDNKNITVFYCMAHARRKIFDAQGNDKARAEYALTEIRKLYDIEASCYEQQLNITQIKEKRQREAIPILQQLGEWMKKEYEQLRPKSAIAQAFAYSIKRWEGLSLYATTGNLHIDNNVIERCMRTVAIGRKNYLFCGSHEAAKRAGKLYSLLVTCKLNDVNPYEWLKDVLSHNIQGMHINKIKDLLPHNWKKNRAQATAGNNNVK
jgi:transposase